MKFLAAEERAGVTVEGSILSQLGEGDKDISQVYLACA